MIIAVGTQAKPKVAAVKEAIALYPSLKGAHIAMVKVDSGVSDQPKTMGETIAGAKNRARTAFNATKGAAFAIGLESGLMEVQEARTGYLDFTACAVYDGRKFALGISPALEYPGETIRLLKEGLDATQAFYRIGLTANPKIGEAEGTYGILTNGRVDRKEYTRLAIIMALVQVERPELYP